LRGLSGNSGSRLGLLRCRRCGLRFRSGCSGAFASARGCGFRILALAGEHGDHLVDRHIGGAFGHEDLRQCAFVDRLDLHRGLVGLDLGDHIAGFDRVAFVLEPLGKVALFHRGRQRGHQNVDRHGLN
jgi:hypothetical protein